MIRSKVILVQPPIEDFYLTKKRTWPYGLACIASCIKQKGFDVEIIDALATDKSKVIDLPESFSFLLPFYGRKDITSLCLFHEFKHFGYSYEYIGASIREKKPLVVGISSLFTPYCNEAIHTARIIKKFYPECKIVLGGHHPTLFPEKVLACPFVDFVLRGEGETSMGMLCLAIEKGGDFKHIPGIAFKQKTKIYMSEPFWIKDFNNFPIPDNDLISHNFYKRKNRHSVMLVSSRGCPMQCSYCSVAASSSHGPFRQRCVDNVIKELEHHIRHHDIGFIDFEDENLCFNKKWFLSLFSEISRLTTGRNIEIRAMNGLYPPAIDEDIVALMKKSGFKTLNLSLGSASQDQLKKFKRRDVRISFENALILAKKYGLECVSYIIAAAPDQTAESSLKDLLYLARKKTLVGLSIYYPAPGSLDYLLCKTKNILPENFSLMRSTAMGLNDTTSRIEAATLLRLSRILNFMKKLIDIDGSLPEPKALSCQTVKMPSNRYAVSCLILQYFLYDGIIRGVQPDGKIYPHATDKTLTSKFIKAIKTLSVTGIK